MKKDEIGKSLGLTPLPEVIPVSQADKPIVAKDDQAAEKDYQYARENFYNVIEKGTHALEDMIEVARASEHPRAYEVVSTIMKTLVDANKDLVQMSDKKVEREAKVEKPGTVNNNLFVGSTADLQKVLKDLKNEK
tara:strand:- start:1052 stop:1456 length:405 start_codon:yes stop_codon:yes gene_type:complete